MATKTFLGKEVKLTSKSWTIVKSSVKKISKKELKTVKEITVKQSDFSDDLYAMISLDEGYITCTIDKVCSRRLSPGDMLAPESILVYDLSNGEKTIQRLYGEVSK